MARVVYIHGFLSSSRSTKAQQTRAWLQTHRPDIRYACPDLSSYPAEALASLKQCLAEFDISDTYLIGSSMGGFWASHLVEQGLAQKAVLVNPAVSPHTRFRELIGQSLKSYYSDQEYCLSASDIDQLAQCESPHIHHPDKFWLMVQTADEVLDYRLATARYTGAKQTVEQGGDHSFQHYEGWLPDIIRFFGI